MTKAPNKSETDKKAESEYTTIVPESESEDEDNTLYKYEKGDQTESFSDNISELYKLFPELDF